MAACFDAEEAGYYQTRDPFGEADVTAPVSGIFGEMWALPRACLRTCGKLARAAEPAGRAR